MKQLKQFRKIAGLTLREVEAKTGISNSYLSQMESGKIKEPSVFKVYALAQLYSVTVETLLEAGIGKAEGSKKY